MDPLDEIEQALAAVAAPALRRAQRRLPDEAAAAGAEAAGETVHRLRGDDGKVAARLAVREEPAREGTGPGPRRYVLDFGTRGKVRVTLERFLE